MKRVLFLGDSITSAGHYTVLFDAFIFTQFPDTPPATCAPTWRKASPSPTPRRKLRRAKQKIREAEKGAK